MAKKYFQKALSVGLSLTLCASLVAPALAANFGDLQNAVNNTKGTQIEGTNRYGYGSQIDDSKYEIEAWNDEDGTRNVQLNADVTREGKEGYVGVGTKPETKDKTLNLDLNGYTIDANDEKTAFQIDSGDVTIQDTSEEKTGTITGGTKAGVIIGKSADVTLEDVTITGNGTGVWVAGANGASFTNESGKITGNNTGILVNENGASATINGGVVDNGLTADKKTSLEINGGSVSGEIKTDSNTSVTITGGTFSSLDEKYLSGHTLENNVFTHAWGDWTENGDGTRTHTCTIDGCGKSETEEIPVVAAPEEPAPVVDTPVEPEIEIDEPAVPLASGPVTCGEFIDYLWRHEGEPEADVVGDHEYAPAISWALSIGIISGDGFEPDELVTVSAARDILSSFAARSDMIMPELTTLVGDEDEAVLNCDEVLAEFFGEGQAE